MIKRFVPLTSVLGLALSLLACGGGSSSPSASMPEDDTQPAPVDPVVCTTPATSVITTAWDDGSNDGHDPLSAIDNSLDENSRWSSLGDGKWIVFDLGSAKDIRELRAAWYKGSERTSYFDLEHSLDATNWNLLADNIQSQGTQSLEEIAIEPVDARYIRLIGHGNSESSWNSLVEFGASDCGDTGTPSQDFDGVITPADPEGQPSADLVQTPAGTPSDVLPIGTLSPSLAPSENFDLSRWYVSVPTDTDGNGRSDSIYENQLNSGYQDPSYFFTGSDGGMVFRCPAYGYRTSTNTKYVRVELREMLRQGNTSISTQGVNKNNWVFSSAPMNAQNNAGGIDGTLKATLAVNEVTTTGESYQQGRVIIGQIHANDDEPIRLYYRKLPGNSKGSIYFAHEPIGSEDLYVEMIGSKETTASDPADGIALDEVFSYEINVQGDILSVSILREGKATITKSISMANSGYDAADQYMYFKAGLYNQNNSADTDDYVQVTFYALQATHN